MASSYILKVSLAGEIRRLRTSLPPLKTIGSKAWLQALKAEVQQGLSASAETKHGGDRFTLKYTAADGEKCLLTEAACEDCVALAGTSNQGELLLRIIAQDAGLLRAPPASASEAAVPSSSSSRAAAVPSSASERKASRVRVIRDIFEGKPSLVPVTQKGATVSKGQATPQVLWTSADGKAFVSLVDVPYRGRQPRLTLGKSGSAFLVRVKPGMLAEDIPFDGSPDHAATLESALDAVRLLAPGMARTPGWHSVALEDGRSLALQLCLEYQLHLCLKRCPSQSTATQSPTCS